MFDWILEIFGRRKAEVPVLKISEISSYEEYRNYSNKHQKANLAKWSFEENLIPNTRSSFTINGYCYVCRTYVAFLADFECSYEVNGILMPNWRERLICPNCRLNNRMRATVHIFEQKCRPNAKSKIYITEQTTALYRCLKQSFPHVYGSEHLGNHVKYGSCNDEGIRNEDLTQLSFGNNEFDYILSFDVFEHIPNYKKAITECFRCLKPNGILYFSVPFFKTLEKNIIRAYVSDTGETFHLLPPEYHVNPLSSDGCLCFYHFGWEILEEINRIGFKDTKALLYWSPELGYLGGEQFVFMATKTKSNNK